MAATDGHGEADNPVELTGDPGRVPEPAKDGDRQLVAALIRHKVDRLSRDLGDGPADGTGRPRRPRRRPGSRRGPDRPIPPKG